MSIKTPAVPIALGNGAYVYHIATADMNGDGKLDAVVGWQFGVKILLGNGNATFGSPQSAIGYGDGVREAFVVASFCGSNRPDVAVASYNLDVFCNTTTNPSTVTFASSHHTVVPQNPQTHTAFGYLAAGDFNRDACADIAAADRTGAVRIFLNRKVAGACTGGFSELPQPSSLSLGHIAIPGGDPSEALAVADFDGDNALDILGVYSDATTGGVFFFKGSGAGTFQPGIRIPDVPASDRADAVVAVSDLNCDRKVDAVVATINSAPYVLISKGNGTFTVKKVAPDVHDSHDIAIADADGNGTLDIITNSHRFAGFDVWLNDGLGNFSNGAQPQRSFTFETGDETAFAAAPFNTATAPTRIQVLAGNFGKGNLRVYSNCDECATASDCPPDDFRLSCTVQDQPNCSTRTWAPTFTITNNSQAAIAGQHCFSYSAQLSCTTPLRACNGNISGSERLGPFSPGQSTSFSPHMGLGSGNCQNCTFAASCSPGGTLFWQHCP